MARCMFCKCGGATVLIADNDRGRFVGKACEVCAAEQATPVEDAQRSRGWFW